MNEVETSIKAALIEKINSKTKPVGSLGTLEMIALQIGTIQQTLTPRLENPTIFVFASDHGITDEKISPYPKEVTYQMVLNFLNKGAAINVFSQQHQIDLKVVDAGVDFDFEADERLINAKIKKGTNNFLLKPAMTHEDGYQAMNQGQKLVKTQRLTGTNIIGFGEMGIGNTSSAAMIMHKLCNLPINQCVGRGTGLDDYGLKHKIEVLTQVSKKYSQLSDPHEILFTVGGFEIAMMTGAMLEAFEQNVVILIDGFIATSALLVAHAINPLILSNCIFCHQSDEHGHKQMLDFLGVKPVLSLGMRLGEGTGIAVAFPIIQSAVAFLNEMASFKEASVSDKS